MWYNARLNAKNAENIDIYPHFGDIQTSGIQNHLLKCDRPIYYGILETSQSISFLSFNLQKMVTSVAQFNIKTNSVTMRFRGMGRNTSKVSIVYTQM